MATFTSFDELSLAFTEEGQGDPVVLLHGFAADSKVNWGRAPLVPALVEHGRRVVLLDARGHGRSAKPHDPAAYGEDAMARDVQALLDHLELDRVDLIGYSMGSLTSMQVAAREPRVGAVVLGGIGGRLLHTSLNRGAIAAALEADGSAGAEDQSARAFRAFADATGADRKALAAVQRGPHPRWPDVVAQVRQPALVIAGENDDLAGSPQELADTLADGRAVTVPGDHINAVIKPEFTEAVLDFLD
jgi:pimeloyl-ACP methyl ester carboxylesterase